MNERISQIFKFNPSGPLLSSLIIMVLVCILAIIVGIQAKVSDPLKKPKGLLFLADYFVERMTNWTRDNMGEGFDNFAGYFMGLASYLFLAFIWSITGLPGIIDNTFAPLSLAVVMFILIHATSMKYKKWGYFHRYIEPVFIFLPVNLLTMWTPILSTTLRMFGNALAGTLIITLVSWALKNASSLIFASLGSGASSIFLAPIPVGILNLYFALFSGFIQTLVFASLNAVWISQERPEEAMGERSQILRSKEIMNQ